MLAKVGHGEKLYAAAGGSARDFDVWILLGEGELVGMRRPAPPPSPGIPGEGEIMMDVQGIFRESVQHHQMGRLREAEAGYRKILKKEPRNAMVTHLLGVVAHQKGRQDEAANLIARAI